MEQSLESRAVWLFNNGHSCTESILKAAEEILGVKECNDIYSMGSVLSHGMGIGCFCGAVLVGIMLIALLFDRTTAKRMRIRLLWGFRERFPDFNCLSLKTHSGPDSCEDVIAHVCRMLEEFVAENANADAH